jgi:hypothetical protein
MHLQQEIAHLHRAAVLLAQHENKQWEQVIPGGVFPTLLNFRDTRDYVRKILAEQLELTADKEDLKKVSDLPENHTFFWYQDKVNADVNSVPSHKVIYQHQKVKGSDYRTEIRPHPVESLRDRTRDDVAIARTKQSKRKIEPTYPSSPPL